MKALSLSLSLSLTLTLTLSLSLSLSLMPIPHRSAIPVGQSAYASYAPDGTPASSHPESGACGSGLDNGPTVEGVPFNLTGLDLQDQYDAGFTGTCLPP
jgi:hypothetical protein